MSTPPRFKVPLSRSVLNDPAFSPDPRSHPHFPLASASSYRFVPPSLSLSASSVSLSSFSSPAVSSTTSLSQSSIRSPSPVALLPPSVSLPPLPIHPKALPEPHPIQPTSLPIWNPDSRRENLRPAPSHNRNTGRKGRMKTLVRRITSHQNLDRIDELDETDPFGANYHHDGPYEAISSNLASRRALKFDTHPDQHQSLSWGSSTHGEMSLSLHLQPGQILRQNTIYTLTSSVPLVSSQSRRQTDTIAAVTPPYILQSRPPTNPRTRAPERSSVSLNLLDEHQNRAFSSSHAPRVEDISPDVPDNLPLHHDPAATSYVLHQTETTVFPPPRHESNLHSLEPPRSHTSSSSKAASRRTQSPESAIPATMPHDSPYQSTHSVDTSHSIKTAMTQSSSAVQNRPPEPPRIRHLPKRLVMPAPLQPQPQHNFPLAGPPGWGDDHLDDHDLKGAYFEGPLAMYNEEPRHLRKRSSSFPAKVPIPDHTPMSRGSAVLPMGNPSTKAAKEPEATKERTRRRKLSKRKHDI